MSDRRIPSRGTERQSDTQKVLLRYWRRCFAALDVTVLQYSAVATASTCTR
jgi:hypothetical protein